MAKVNVKLWNKRVSNASWHPNLHAVSIFPDQNKGMIYCHDYEWIEGTGKKKDELVPKFLKECIIEIEEEGFGIIFNGTFKELCNKLKNI